MRGHRPRTLWSAIAVSVTLALGGLAPPAFAGETFTDADLELTKTSDALLVEGVPTVSPGTPVEYTLTVTNKGPADATQVEVIDYFSKEPDAASIPEDCEIPEFDFALYCTVAFLSAAPGSNTAEFSYTVTAGGSTLMNDASVSADQPDPDPTNDGDFHDVVVECAPDQCTDLVLDKEGPAIVLPDDVVDYTITVSNAGPGDAETVKVTDTLPRGTWFNAELSDERCVQGLGGPDDPATVVCDRTSLPADDSTTSAHVWTFHIVLNIHDPSAGPLWNEAVVELGPGQHEVNDVDNWDFAETDIDCSGGGCEPPCDPDFGCSEFEAGLQVTKSDLWDPVEVGDSIAYSIGVFNNSDQTNVITLEDRLPPQLLNPSFAPKYSWINPHDQCDIAESLIECVFTLPPFTRGHFGVFGDAPGEDAILVNEVEVDGDAPDPVPFDNLFREATTVGSPASVDMGIYKDAPDFALPGEPLTYWIAVWTWDEVASATVRDILPANATFVSATNGDSGFGGDVTCPAPAAGTLTCTVDLSEGYAAIEVVVEPTGEVGDVVSNYAEVEPAGAPDGFLWDNRTWVHTTLAPVGSTDLEIWKDAPFYAGVGAPLQYGIWADNTGPSASSMVVTDPLPANVEFVTAWFFTEADDDWDDGLEHPCDYDGVGHEVTCDLGTRPPGGYGWIVIEVTPASGNSGDVIENTATVSGDAPELDPGDNSSTAESELAAPGTADLYVWKDGAGDAVRDMPFLYTMGVYNAGPFDAQGVVITDTLPSNASFESIQVLDRPGAICDAAPSGGEISCDVGTIAVGDWVTVEVVVTPTSGTELENTVSASHSGTDPHPWNDSSDAFDDILLEGSADLVLHKSGDADTATAGDPFTFWIDVWNDGPTGATDVTVTDTLPAGVAFVSAEPSSGTCDPPADGVLTCDLGLIPSWGGEWIEVIVTPNAVGPMTNEADVDSTTDDPDPDNNHAEATVEVEEGAGEPGVADLEVTKEASIWAPPTAGSPLWYEIEVENHGPDAAGGVTLVDELPAGTTFGSAWPSQGTCPAPVLGVLTCNLGTIGNGDMAWVWVSVTPSAPGDIVNEVSVAHADVDPEPGNGSDSVTTTIHPAGAADLSVTKTDSIEPATVGNAFRYTMTVQNHSGSAVSTATLTDTLPENVAIGAVTTSSGWSCDTVGVDRELTCTGPVGAWSSAWVKVLVTPQAAAQGTTLSNTATVSASDDPIPGNDSDTETTDVRPSVTSGSGASSSSGTVTTDSETGQTQIEMGRFELAPIAFSTTAACPPDGTTAAGVTLVVDYDDPVLPDHQQAMANTGGNTWSTTVGTSRLGSAKIVFRVDCGGDTGVVENGGPRIVLYDPSGFVRDAVTNAIIPGATVHLYRVPGWRARVNPADMAAETCESNDSKGSATWSQPAPTGLGVLADPGSGLISPAINPQTTDAAGHYGWDVAAGCWYIVVSKAGYETVTSPVVGVPPEVTDLDVKISPIKQPQQDPPQAPPQVVQKGGKSLGLKAKPTAVPKGKKAKVTATAGPCPGASGDAVQLQKKQGANWVTIATAKAGATCAAKFKVKVKKMVILRAFAPEDADHLAATSNQVKLRVKKA